MKNKAEEHVDWLLEIIRPLLITEFEHGYEHGLKESLKGEKEDGSNNKNLETK